MAGKLIGKQVKVTCKNCNKKAIVIQYSASPEPGVMMDIEKAPCKNCGEENILSSIKRIRGPAEVDLLNASEIIQYFRDLFNLSNLLGGKLDVEMLKFIKKLSAANWGKVEIHRFITVAGYGTRYDKLQDFEGHKVVERPLPQRGEWKEWLRLKPRAM